MQNLKYPVKKIFIPSISLTDIKMYKSSEDGRFVLHFLKEGYSIKGQAAPAAFTDPTATTIQTGLQYLSRTTTNFGQPSSFLISFSDQSTDHNGLAISIREMVERPGFDNSKDNREFRTYNGYVVNPTITNGIIDATSMETMKIQIMEAMEDAFKSRNNIDYLSDDLYSSAIARKVVSLSSLLTSTALGVTPGKTTTVSQAATTVRYTITATNDTTDNQWGVQDSTTGITVTEAQAIAQGVDTTTYEYYSIAAGTVGSATSVTYTAGTAYTLDPLGTLPSANAISQLEYSVDSDTTTATKFLRTVNLTPYFVANLGGVYHVFSKTDFEDFDASATGITSTTLLWIRGASSYVHFEILNPDSQIEVKYLQIDQLDSGGTNYLNTGTTNSDGLVNVGNMLNLNTFDGVNFHSQGPGTYPILTAYKIAEEFRAYNMAPGAFEAALYGSFPVVGTEYVKYEICSEIPDIPNLHGASHRNSYHQRLLIYAPLSLVDDAKWDDPEALNAWTGWKADTATSAAMSFEQLLLYFTGTVLTSWK